MRRVTAAALTLLVVAALTGCGIPSSTDVQVRGGMPSPEAPGGADTIPPLDRKNANTGTARDLVDAFLTAAAGDPEQAVDRARSFISPLISADWKPSSEINIVRLLEEPVVTPVDASSFTAEVRVQHLGVLSANGSIDPPNNEETEYTLTVGEVPGQIGFWVTRGAPRVLLLRDSELLKRYTPTSVYFWNKDRTALVPDLRWLPRSISAERRPTELLEWLSGGPSGLIAPAVDGLPANVKQKGNVPKVGTDRALEVNLSAEAGALDEDALNRLGAQLYWTLREYFSGDLLVKVEGQLRKTFDSELLTANPWSEVPEQPERFAIYDGTITRLRETGQTSVAPVPLVTEETNSGVSVATFARLGARVFGAWVRDRGAEAGQELVVSAEVPGMPLRIPLGDSVAGRPVWLWAPGTLADEDVASMVGLIVVDGKLQQFGTQVTTREPVAVTGLPGPIAAMAVAHDGQRIALVSGGRLFVTALIRTDTSVKVSTAVREVNTSLHDVTAVDFAAQDQLLVAGEQPGSNRAGIVQVTLDGAWQLSRATELGSAQVTHLAAYPVNPLRTINAGSEAAFVANNIPYRLLASSTKIEPTQLADPPADAVSNKITAPFFLE